MKLLVADTDQEFLDLVHYTFMPDGFVVVPAFDGESAIKLYAREHPDLVLLGRWLAKRDGLELLKEMRSRASVPIIMLTGAYDEEHLVNAFQLGADDCLSKPVRARELRARVHALLRRAQGGPWNQNETKRLELGDIMLDARTRRVTVRGQAVHLSRTEFELLQFLMQRHDAVVHLPQLVASVWGYEGKESENVVKVAISRLRRKIEPDPSFPRHIVNVPGVGYMFQCEAPSMQPA